MKRFLVFLAVGAFILGSFLTIGVLTEQSKPLPNVVFYEVPTTLPTQVQYERAVSTPAQIGATAYAVIQINPVEEVEI